MPGPSIPSPPSWSGTGRISGPEDVHRVLADINAAGLHRDNTALASQLVQPAETIGIADGDVSRLLPVDPVLTGLLPWSGGIRRGATVAAVGSLSLIMVVLSGALAAGGWGAVVGIPAFGVLAAAEAGVPLDRLALVPDPGPDWPAVVAALIDGVDLVVVASPAGADGGVTRALMARARQKGSVLIPTTAWTGCDLAITLTSRSWTGLGQGRGRLRSQNLVLESVGRGRAVQPSRATITTPVVPEPVMLAMVPELQATPTGPVAVDDLWAEVQPNEPRRDPWAHLQR